MTSVKRSGLTEQLLDLIATLRSNRELPPPRSLEEARSRADHANNLATEPADIIFTPTPVGGVRCEWADKVAQTAGPADRTVIVYVHGGGFVAGSLESHRNMIGHLAAHTGLPCLGIAYRLAPEHPYPAAIDDVLAVCDALERDGTRIVLAGDSAGANIALATAIQRKASRRPLVALILLSPLLDLSFSGNSVARNADLDAMLNLRQLRHGADAYRSDLDPSDPNVSPLFAELQDLAPLIVHTGTAEILYDDATRLVARARLAGVDTWLIETAGAPHVVTQGAGNVPEADDVLADIAHLLRAITPKDDQ
jgi:epsilon-lactone hydrolase